MHISEGVLSAPVLLGGAALALGGLAKGLKTIGEDDLPRAAVLAAVFFVASLIHVPVPFVPVSAHLVLSGLIGLFLGWGAAPVIFAGLLLQGILFQYGGLTVLGVNTFNMAAPAILLGSLFRRIVNSRSKIKFAAAFVCGGGAILGSALLTALSLYLSGEEFRVLALGVLAAHLPLALLEGFLCALVAGFLAKVRPSFLAGPALDAGGFNRA